MSKRNLKKLRKNIEKIFTNFVESRSSETRNLEKYKKFFAILMSAIQYNLKDITSSYQIFKDISEFYETNLNSRQIKFFPNISTDKAFKLQKKNFLKSFDNKTKYNIIDNYFSDIPAKQEEANKQKPNQLLV